MQSGFAIGNQAVVVNPAIRERLYQTRHKSAKLNSEARRTVVSAGSSIAWRAAVNQSLRLRILFHARDVAGTTERSFALA
jgi:hypothetical protein